MENFRACASRSDRGEACAINVGDTERTISTAAGAFVLLYGLSKLPFSTIVAAVSGGALLYRGLTGHCSAYQALNMSTSRALENDKWSGHRRRPLHEGTDASLAATGEAPPISAS